MQLSLFVRLAVLAVEPALVQNVPVMITVALAPTVVTDPTAMPRADTEVEDRFSVRARNATRKEGLTNAVAA